VSRSDPRRSPTRSLLTAVAVTLTLTTAYVHATLGSVLFTLNAVGYATFAVLLVIAATVPHPVATRFAWLPGVGLAGYATVTVASYLIVGPYFALGWIAKGIEMALIGVIAADLIGAYGNVRGVVHAAASSLHPARKAS
jgi:hypothetical protein